MWYNVHGDNMKKKKHVSIHESLNKSRNFIKGMIFVLVVLGLGIGFLVLRKTTSLFNDVNKAEEEKITIAINEYIEKLEDEQRKSTLTKCFAANKVYLVERIIDNDGDLNKQYKNYDNYYYAYSWVQETSYYKENGELKKDGGSSIPHKILLGKKGDTYTALKHEIPRDGTYYPEDMKKLFPSKIRTKINNAPVDGTVEKLIKEIETKAEEYYK